jgi:ADP-ribose pyrophosphatase
MESTLESRHVYEGKIVNLRVDLVELPGGRAAEREIVEHRGAVAIVAVDREGSVLLVRQYRKAVEAELLELPAGTLEPGEPAEACAARELGEETGARASEMRLMAMYYSSPGFCTEEMHIFLATGLDLDAARPEGDEQLELARMPLQEAVRMARSGLLRDSKSIIGLLLADRCLSEAGSEER